MKIDSDSTTAINSFAGYSHGLDAVMIFYAKIGIFILVATVAVRWYWPGERTMNRFVALSAGFAVALGLILNQAILLFVDRMRPYDTGITHLIVERSADPSFPSNHATVVFAVAFLFLIKREVTAWWYVHAAIVVGLARIFIGTHYLTDVMGGAATALAAAIVVNRAYKHVSAINRSLVKLF